MALVHYEGKLGEFDYDDEVFEISVKDRLRLREDYKGPIDLPHGCVSCVSLFEGRDLTGCSLRDFDTSTVVDMGGMFLGCKLPDSFALGDKFDTSRVTNMASMFRACELPKGFTLGDKFDTSNVINMASMFNGCTFPEGFTLGDKFDTSNVENMGHMFFECIFNEDFILGSKFDTSKVTKMTSMFIKAKLPSGFKGLVSFSEIIKTLKRGRGTFDCVGYLKGLFGAQYSYLPQASVINCETKEDCDELYRRFI